MSDTRLNPVDSPITLASASPRRRELLQQIQVSYALLPVDIDESPLPGEAPEQLVQRLAQQKAAAGFALQPRRPALGSDTIVVIDNEALGKPVDRQHAIEMLGKLSGRSHQVMTAVAVCSEDKQSCVLNTSEVQFCELSAEQIEAYWQTGEPLGKAGGYGIQGLAAQFIVTISGSYSGIMGLPLYETAELLKQHGVYTGLHR
ncbi:MAG TPA: Maf family protein [Gammaproteobacteria bacterium]